MTRDQFVRKAIRGEERRLEIPAGWWGTWTDFTNGTLRIRRSGTIWTLSRAGKRISRHDSRRFAISKSRKL